MFSWDISEQEENLTGAEIGRARARVRKSFAVVNVCFSSCFCVGARARACWHFCALMRARFLSHSVKRWLMCAWTARAVMDYILSWTGSGARAVREAISSRMWPATGREVHFTDYSDVSHGSNNTGLTTSAKLSFQVFAPLKKKEKKSSAAVLFWT